MLRDKSRTCSQINIFACLLRRAYTVEAGSVSGEHDAGRLRRQQHAGGATQSGTWKDMQFDSWCLR